MEKTQKTGGGEGFVIVSLVETSPLRVSRRASQVSCAFVFLRKDGWSGPQVSRQVENDQVRNTWSGVMKLPCARTFHTPCVISGTCGVRAFSRIGSWTIGYWTVLCGSLNTLPRQNKRWEERPSAHPERWLTCFPSDVNFATPSDLFFWRRIAGVGF